MNLLEDWLKLCNGEENYNSSHFYTLFHKDFSFSEIEKIFSCFEEKDELVSRYWNYKQPKEHLSNSEILELIKVDLENKKEFCELLKGSELIEAMRDINYSFVTIEEFKNIKNADLPQVWLMELIGDNQRYSYNDSLKNNAIIEAFYGLTSNNNLVWYLAAPIFNSKFNPNPYFEIWRKSGDYVLGNNEVYILNENGTKA